MRYALNFLLFLISLMAYGQEIIPFELRDDNRIYVKTTVNQSDTLDFVFDLGANITVLNKTRLKQNSIDIQFDNTVSNRGANGVSQEQVSSNNSVRLGNKTYGNIRILGISYPENDQLDGIIGWNFFDDKVVKIDYEDKKLLVYESMGNRPTWYVKNKMKIIGGLPYIQIHVYKGKGKAKIWAMLDTGYNDGLLIYYEPSYNHKLLNRYPLIGEGATSGTDGRVYKSDMVLVSQINVGGFELYNTPAFLTTTPSKSTKPALLGGKLLKRFHILLDFKTKHVYLSPNILINSTY